MDLSWSCLAWNFRRQLVAGFVLVLVNRALGLSIPAAMKFMVDDVLHNQNERVLLPLIAAVVFATILQGLTTYGIKSVLLVPAEKLILTIRQRLQTHLGAVAVSYIDANKTGNLVTTVTTDVEYLRNILGSELVEVFGGLATCFVTIVVLLHISSYLAVGTVVAIALSGYIVYGQLKHTRPFYKRRSNSYADVTSAITEYLQGIRVTKAYGADWVARSTFRDSTRDLSHCDLKVSDLVCRISVTARALLAMVAGAVMYIGGHEVLQGRITAGEFITFTAFLAFMGKPLMQTVRTAGRLSEGLAALSRIREVLRQPTEVDDVSHSRRSIVGAINSIEFENVWFSYPNGGPVLRDISVSAGCGTVTAIVGSSGSGKSTMMSLIASFYAPTSGRVLVDGVDLSQVQLDSYRTQLGIVLQETFLFNRTIRENVMLARPDADESAFLEACRVARVDRLADELPLGYETVVGERGMKISGGQRQRIAIARALLANPAVLLLDEATSNLDAESEAAVQGSLTHLMRGRTTFVVTHRLSSVRNADQILVLEQGRIVERGRHEDLLRRGGRYSELVLTESQAFEEAEAFSR